MVVMPMNNKDFDAEVEDFFKHYKDRGMVKWAGFYLSDHQVKINKKLKDDAYIEHKQEEMSLEDISKVLLKAFSEDRLVSVQLSLLNLEGQIKKAYTGHVLGVSEDKVIVDDEIFSLSEINHIEIVTTQN